MTFEVGDRVELTGEHEGHTGTIMFLLGMPPTEAYVEVFPGAIEHYEWVRGDFAGPGERTFALNRLPITSLRRMSDPCVEST